MQGANLSPCTHQSIVYTFNQMNEIKKFQWPAALEEDLIEEVRKSRTIFTLFRSNQK